MTDDNPYSSNNIHPSQKRATLWPHLLGCCCSIFALAASLGQPYVPPQHPAYGGANPIAVLALVLAPSLCCAVLALLLPFAVLFQRRWGLLLYLLPPALCSMRSARLIAETLGW